MEKMTKIDLKKELKELYLAKSEPCFVKVPKQKIISIQGQGNPNTSKDFKDAIETLFPIAFKVKFASKKELDRDYVVMPLEALWWTNNMKEFSTENKDIWKWKIFIVQPDFITNELYEKVLSEIKKIKNLPAINKIKFETIEEGESVQILHIGSYSKEAPTIKKMHKYILDNNYTFNGLIQKHHEIYLSDMRKTPEDRLRTILRQSVVKKEVKNE